jgi:uncharacterized protein YuzE
MEVAEIINKIYTSSKYIFETGIAEVSFDFDKEADVMFVSFEKPQKATKTLPQDDGSLLRYNSKGKLVGITFMHYSKK